MTSSAARPSLSFIVSLGLHVGVLLVMAGFEVERRLNPTIEFEVAEAREQKKEPEPEPEEPEPEEPEPEEPEPELRPAEPPPKRKPVRKPVETQEEPDPTPPPQIKIELPPDQTVSGGQSGVSVGVGSSTRVIRQPRGKKGGKPGGKGRASGDGDGSSTADGPTWEPKTDLFIKRLPAVVRVPEIRCAAVTELEISGTVVLKVQVRKDGSVRKVRVAKGIGHGCDKVAAKALKRAKFKPAIATNGKAADYELRYEYVFELDE